MYVYNWLLFYAPYAGKKKNSDYKEGFVYGSIFLKKQNKIWTAFFELKLQF